MKLPDQPEFDLPVRLTLGRLTERQLARRGLPVPERYCRIPGSVTFDYLDPESNDFYTFSARIVRLKLEDGSTQTLITNLDPAQFPLSELKALYAKRWGIETSFRELKYTVGLLHLHSRKSELVLQEYLLPLPSSTSPKPPLGAWMRTGAAQNTSDASTSPMRSTYAVRPCAAGLVR